MIVALMKRKMERMLIKRDSILKTETCYATLFSIVCSQRINLYIDRQSFMLISTLASYLFMYKTFLSFQCSGI